MVVHIGLFSSSSDWRRRQEGAMDRVSSHFAVLCTVWFKIIAFVCIMDCSQLLHGGTYWIVQWFVYGLFAVIALKCTLEY